MEGLIEVVRLSVNKSEWEGLRKKLNEKFDVIQSAGVTAHGATNWLLSAVQILNRPEHAVGLAILLSIQAEVVVEEHFNAFIDTSVLLLSVATADSVSFASKEVSAVLRKVVSIFISRGNARGAIRLLLRAIPLMAPTPVCLTPLHPLLLQACIAGDMYSLACTYLQGNVITEVDAKTSLQPLDLLTYFYYSGICFCATKNFKAALNSFLVVLTTPASTVSEVVVEAAKKFKLVSLIYKGSPTELPRWTSVPVLKYFQQDSPVYDSISQQFTANSDSLSTTIAEAERVLRSDNNWGLALQVLEARVTHAIRRLSKVYVTQSLRGFSQQLRSHSGVDVSEQQLEVLLVKLISDDEIAAVINQQTGVIHFQDVEVEDPETTEVLQQHLHDILLLTDKLHDIHFSSITSPAFISKTTSSKGRGAGGAWTQESGERL